MSIKHLTVRHLKTQRPRTDSDSVASQSLVTKRRSSTPVNGGKKGASKRWREYSPVGFQYYCRFGSCTRKYVTYEQLEHHVTEYHINMMTSLAETGESRGHQALFGPKSLGFDTTSFSVQALTSRQAKAARRNETPKRKPLLI